MIDTIIGVIATIISTMIIGLFSLFLLKPYEDNLIVRKYVLKIIRNFNDPRDEKYAIEKCIEEQLSSIQEVLDLISEQCELHPILSKLFKYNDLIMNLNFLSEYIRNPIMLNDSKEFEDSYVLNKDKYYKTLKSCAKFPLLKFALIGFILFGLLLGIIIFAIKLSLHIT